MISLVHITFLDNSISNLSFQNFSKAPERMYCTVNVFEFEAEAWWDFGSVNDSASTPSSLIQRPVGAHILCMNRIMNVHVQEGLWLPLDKVSIGSHARNY
jgi:hypothetical protein